MVVWLRFKVDPGKLSQGGTWIGGSDFAQEDDWTWIDGTPWPSIDCKRVRDEFADYSY